MIYSAILQNLRIIADYSENPGDFNDILIKILKANKQPIDFYVIPYQNYEFYFLQEKEKNYIFSCIVNSNTDNEKVLLFLQNLKENFSMICGKDTDNLTLKATNLIKESMVKNFNKKINIKSQDISNQSRTINLIKLKHSWK